MAYPDPRLLALVAAWTASAVIAVALPPWRVVSVGLAALLAAAAALDVLAMHRRPRLRVQRRLPERATVGRPAPITVVLENPGAGDATASVLDEAPEDVTVDEPTFTVRLQGGETRTLTYTALPTRRGDRVFGPTYVFERSPFGLWRRRTTGEAGAALAVYPDTTALVGRHALDARRLAAALGLRVIPRRGEGMEFESLREYVVGDDPRRIDWAATVRRRRLITRRYRHERHHTVLLAVDSSRLMGARIGSRTKLDAAVDACLGVAYAALTAGDRVGVIVFDAEVRAYLAPRAHRRRFGAVVDVLRTAAPQLVETDFAALARTLTVHQRQRALVVVLTDVVDAAATQLEPLAMLARRHRLLVVTVRDPVFDALAPGAARPDEPVLALYRRLALDDLLRARDVALARLRHAGIDAADLPPHRLTTAVLNRYLPLRERTV